MSRYSYSSGSSMPLHALIILFLITLFICANLTSCQIDSEREQAGMILIEDNYYYNIDTKIIHVETLTGGRRTRYKPVYIPYITSNGNYCRYENGEWIEIFK